jgi:hypothetical protein
MRSSSAGWRPTPRSPETKVATDVSAGVSLPLASDLIGPNNAKSGLRLDYDNPIDRCFASTTTFNKHKIGWGIRSVQSIGPIRGNNS